MGSRVNQHKICYASMLLIPLLVVSLTGWTTESRRFELDDFDRVYFSGIGTLRLIQGGKPAAVAAGDPLTLDQLVIDSSDGILYIDSEASNIAADGLVIEITVSRLRELVSDGLGVISSTDLAVDKLVLEGRGAGKFTFANLRADELVVTGQGSTDFELSGEVQRQIVAIDGVGSYRASHLASRSSEVSVFGSGDILLWVEDLLDVKVAGAARVRYLGTPLVLQDILGLGTVSRANN